MIWYLLVAILVMFWMLGKRNLDPQWVEGRRVRGDRFWDHGVLWVSLLWPAVALYLLLWWVSVGHDRPTAQQIRDYEGAQRGADRATRLRELRDEARGFAEQNDWAHPLTQQMYADLAAVWSHELGDSPEFVDKVQRARDAGFDVDFMDQMDDPLVRRAFDGWYEKHVRPIASATELRTAGVRVTRRAR